MACLSLRPGGAAASQEFIETSVDRELMGGKLNPFGCGVARLELPTASLVDRTGSCIKLSNVYVS